MKHIVFTTYFNSIFLASWSSKRTENSVVSGKAFFYIYPYVFASSKASKLLLKVPTA